MNDDARDALTLRWIEAMERVARATEEAVTLEKAWQERQRAATKAAAESA